MIVLKSEKLIVNKILKKTKAQFFCDLKGGDVIQLSMDARYPGRGRNGIFAPSMVFTNLTSGITLKGKLSDTKYLDCFEFVSQD